MAYQLVLQFHGASLENFARLGNPEDAVTDLLGPGESFDGLDVGKHGANVFVYTDEPEATFQRIRPTLRDAESVEGFTVAYRQVAAEVFRVLWPRDSAQAFHLR